LLPQKKKCFSLSKKKDYEKRKGNNFCHVEESYGTEEEGGKEGMGGKGKSDVKRERQWGEIRWNFSGGARHC